MEVVTSDAFIWVPLGYLFDQGLLADQDTLDQLLVISDGEGRIFSIVPVAKDLEVGAVLHPIVIEGHPVHYDIIVILVHLVHVVSPSLQLLRHELLPALVQTQVAVPLMEKLAHIEYVRAFLQSLLDQLLIEKPELRKG